MEVFHTVEGVTRRGYVPPVRSVMRTALAATFALLNDTNAAIAWPCALSIADARDNILFASETTSSKFCCYYKSY